MSIIMMIKIMRDKMITMVLLMIIVIIARLAPALVVPWRRGRGR